MAKNLFGKRATLEELEKEVLMLRKKNLKYRLNIDVLVLEPHSERARKIREKRLIYNLPSKFYTNMEGMKTPPFDDAKVADVPVNKVINR